MRTLKKTLALVLVLAMMFSLCITASADFVDADEIQYTEEVEVMTAIGVIEGMGNDVFDPTGTLTRAQAATILVRLLGAEDLATAAEATFTDVAADHWAAAAIAYCVEEGIVDGYGDGKFGPSDPLTGYQWAKMLLIGVYGYDAEEEGMTGTAWQVPTAKLANSVGLFAGNDKADKTVAATREEACLYAFNAAVDGLEETVYQVKLAKTADGETTYETYDFDNQNDALLFLAVNDNAEWVGKKVNTVGSLLADTHDVIRSVGANDAFGRVCTTYVDEKTNGDVIDLAYFLEPVYTTTEAVYGGTLYTELGKPVVKSLSYNQNGTQKEQIDDTSFAIASGNKGTVGAPGMVTEVYNLGQGKYSIVSYNVWAGKITDWTDATYDKDGDLVSPEYVEITDLYNNAKYDFVTADFAKADKIDGTIVAFTATKNAGKWYVKSAEAAEVVTGTMSKYNAAYNQYTIGEEVYAQNANYSADITKLAGTETEYYLDANGYIIYTDDVYVAPNYAILTQLAYVTPNATGAIGETAKAYVEAELVHFDGTKEIVKISTLTGTSKTVYAAAAGTGVDKVIVDKDTAGETEYTIKALQNAFENKIVEYKVNSKTGAYAITEIKSDISVDKAALSAASAFITGEKADNNTVFVVRTGTDTPVDPYVYTVYTGYAKLPAASLKEATVIGVETTAGVAALVYITTTVDDTPEDDGSIVYVIGAGTYNYVAAPGTSYYEYNVIVDGAASTIKVEDELDLTKSRLYIVNSVDEDGFADVKEQAFDTIKVAAKNGSVELTSAGVKSYAGTETVYVIDPITGAVDAEATVEDLEEGQSVYVTYVKDKENNDTNYIAAVIAVEVED